VTGYTATGGAGGGALVGGGVDRVIVEVDGDDDDVCCCGAEGLQDSSAIPTVASTTGPAIRLKTLMAQR
jgi:hypothetical protein